MMPCPADADFARFVDGSLSLEKTERFLAHVACCQRCREHDRLLRTLISDLKAADPATVDVHAHTLAVMERVKRIERPAVASAPPRRAWLFGVAGSAAAFVVCGAAYLGLREQRAGGTWQARGGQAQATIARDVGVQPYAVTGAGLGRLASGATIDRATPLTAVFRNLGHESAFLLLFAVDAHHAVHWISPRYLRPGDNPLATVLPPSLDEHVLGTTAVLEDVAVGSLRIVAVITSTPAHVSDVESLGGVDLGVGRLVRQLPGADVREVIVEMRETDGAMQ